MVQNAIKLVYDQAREDGNIKYNHNYLDNTERLSTKALFIRLDNLWNFITLDRSQPMSPK